MWLESHSYDKPSPGCLQELSVTVPNVHPRLDKAQLITVDKAKYVLYVLSFELRPPTSQHHAREHNVLSREYMIRDSEHGFFKNDVTFLFAQNLI